MLMVQVKIAENTNSHDYSLRDWQDTIIARSVT
jgi:hypothetical protein